MTTDAAFRTEDVLPVRSRITWAPIFAGAVVALAVYFLLTLLGTAIGFSVVDDIRPDNIRTGAALWAIVVTAFSLFLGGWLASQLSVGETKNEAFAYGIILWGVVFAMLMWLLASGVRAGFNAMVGVAGATRSVADVGNLTAQDWEAAARRAGIPQERIDRMREQAGDPTETQANPSDASATASARDLGRDVRNAARSASWWAFGGTLASMLAAILGSVVGAGPSVRVFDIQPRRVAYREGGVALKG